MNTNTKDSSLDSADRQRYQRHLQLKNFGAPSQMKLKNAHVIIIGLGGLGCPVSQYLTAAGVGQLTFVDGDHVELSNLQRQPLFCEDDLGKNKAASAKKRLEKLNSAITIQTIENQLDFHNAENILKAGDLILDCTDNFQARYLINDNCKKLGISWIYGSVLGFDGQFALFNNTKTDHARHEASKPKTPCFRCLFPQAADVQDCNQAGVLGVLPGIIGLHQALLALQVLTEKVDTEHTYLHLFSGHDLQVRKIQLQTSSNCPSCLGKVFIESDYQFKTECLMNTKGSALKQNDKYFISASEFTKDTQNSKHQLIDIRSEAEHENHNIGGSNIPLDQWTDANELDPKSSYIIYCQSGMRSQKLISKLVEAHEGNLPVEIKSLIGGLDDLANINKT